MTRIWYHCTDADKGTPWYIQAPDGKMHAATWFEALGPTWGDFNAEGFRDLPCGPRAVLVTRSPVRFGSGADAPLARKDPDAS